MNEVLLEEMLREMDCAKVRMMSGNVMATCPFAPWTHATGRDKNPSFSIEINASGESRWNCFACDSRGRSVSSLIYKYRGHSGRDLMHWTSEAQKDKPPSAREEYRPRVFTEQPDTWGRHQWYQIKNEPKFDIKDFEEHLKEIPAYALTRGITVEQAKEWKLGFDRKHNRMFIPVFDWFGSMVGYSGRAILKEQSPKYFHAPGFVKENYFYGEHRVRSDVKRAFLCEGFMDVWALDRAGVANPLAFFGAGVGEKQVVKILKWFNEVVVMPHNDPAPDKPTRDNPDCLSPGLRIAQAWQRALQDVGVKVILGPTIPGKKDVGDWEPLEIHWALKMIEDNRSGV